MSILLLIPVGTTPLEWATDCDVVSCAGVDDLVRALARRFDAAIIVSDGLEAGDLDAVAAAVSACSRPVVEVRSERWDGASHSPLSAACRGVISGFGLAGVAAAVRVLTAP